MSARSARRARLAARTTSIALAAVLLVAGARALQVPPGGSGDGRPQVDSKDEAFEKVDPYTRGEDAAMDRAGYESFGPFLFAKGIRTQDAEETLGNIPVLWLETAHFKIGSTLKTYAFRGDQREEKRFKEELARLKPRFERFKPPRGKLDPWLRLHLQAMRLEEQYADFVRTFAVAEDDPAFASTDAEAGPYLGLAMKYTVLLLEKDSSLVRFAKRYLDQEAQGFLRWKLPGGTMLLAISAEGVRGYGYELASSLDCMVAAELTHNLLDGYRRSWPACPTWFRYGLAHDVSRRIDVRWTISATGTTREFGDDSWKWEPRVERLIANGFVPGWDALVAIGDWNDMKAQTHMLAWSRVAWLLRRDPSALKCYLDALCTPLGTAQGEEKAKLQAERARDAAKACFGATLEELDAEWRAFASKPASR